MGRVLRPNSAPLDPSLIVKTMGRFSFLKNADFFVDPAYRHNHGSSSMSQGDQRIQIWQKKSLLTKSEIARVG